MDNTNNDYTSAVEALQLGAKKASGDYLIFIHQDVEFLVPTIVEEIISFFDNYPLSKKYLNGDQNNPKEKISNKLITSQYLHSQLLSFLQL